MNRFTPSDSFAVTDSMVAAEDTAAMQSTDTATAADTATEPAADQSGEGAADTTDQPKNAAAEGSEGAADTQPAAKAETPAQGQKGGPNESFAAQRRALEAAEAAAREKLFGEMTAGMNNPATGKPFANMDEWKSWREDTRLKQLARQTGQTVEQIRRQEADATARAKAEFEASPEYQQALQAQQMMRLQLQQMQFAQDLAEIKAAYPAETASSIEELGEVYMRLRAADIDNLTAYKVLQTQAAQTAAAMPPSTGDVKPTADTRKSDYYSREELERMSGAEMDANWDKVMESMKRLR